MVTQCAGKTHHHHQQASIRY